MINFSEEIIKQSNNPKKIDFLFQSFAKSIKYINNSWEIQVDNKLIKSKILVLSSSFIAHPRCLDVLKLNSLPLRDALFNGEDEIFDCVLRELRKQKYIARRIYIFHVISSTEVKKFNHQYLQIVFSKVIKDNLNFERLIFQGQSDGSMIITLHCSFIEYIVDLTKDDITKSLISIFCNHQIYLDLLIKARLIDKMDWRASQPLNHLLSKKLQWSSNINIGFCGDWFDFGNCGALERAMNSSIRLAQLINFN